MYDDIKNRVSGARVYRRPESPVWQVQFIDEYGRKVRRSSKLVDETEAWKFLDQLYLRHTQLSFKKAVVDFFAVKTKNLASNTIDGYKNSLKNVNPFFRDMSLAEIDLESIKSFIRARRLEVSDETVRKDVAFVSSLFSHAISSMNGAPDVNPFIGLSKRHLKKSQRDYYLTRDEFSRLCSVCQSDFQRQVLTVAVYTGMRHQEICQFQKDWINWERGMIGEIRLPREYTKSKRPRVIPILPELEDTLRFRVEQDDSPWVFAREDTLEPFTSFRGFFRNARKNAKLNNLRFHDLRHTFASWWIQRGGTIYVLKDILGHATLQMVERYAHLDTEAAHREVRHITGHNEEDTQTQEK